MNKSTGGSAFPRVTEQTVMGYNGTLEGERGMTLRDYFAAKAMTAELITSGAHDAPAIALAEAADKNGRTVEEQIAWNAYQLADAMLEERVK